jgi:hypothetical protein
MPEVRNGSRKYVDAEYRVDTKPALQALIDALGGGFRPASRVIGTSHTALWHMIKGSRPAPMLDTMIAYARRAKKETGIQMSFTVSHTGVLDFSLENAD